MAGVGQLVSKLSIETTNSMNDLETRLQVMMMIIIIIIIIIMMIMVIMMLPVLMVTSGSACVKTEH